MSQVIALERLEQEHHRFWESVQQLVQHCIAYKSDVGRKEGKKPSLTLGWTGSDAFIDSRESLRYRANCLVWHVMLLAKTKHDFMALSEQTINDTGKNIDVRRQAMYNLAYIFDDVVFHAVSLFDYLGDVILKCHLEKYRGDRQWNRVVKMTNQIQDKSLMEAMKKIDDTWVKSLSRYRGSIIHNKAEMGSVGVSRNYNSEGVSFNHSFEIPQRAYEALSIFSGQNDVQILDGATQIANNSLIHANEIIVHLRNFEYPLLRNGIFEQDKFN